MSKKQQRGFVLVTALTLSMLYFALMELMLIDCSRALGEAQRFRAHVVATTLAESAAERAAFQIVTRSNVQVKETDFQGTQEGELRRLSNDFTLTGKGTAIGSMTQVATVIVQGRIDPQSNKLMIDFTVHKGQ